MRAITSTMSVSIIAASRRSVATNSAERSEALSCFPSTTDAIAPTSSGNIRDFARSSAPPKFSRCRPKRSAMALRTCAFRTIRVAVDPDTLTVPVADTIQPVLHAYPLPNDPAGPYGDRTFATSSKVKTVTDQFSIRVDHRLSNKAQLFTRFSLNQVTGPVTNPDQTALDPSFAVQFFDHQRNAGVSYSRTISP